MTIPKKVVSPAEAGVQREYNDLRILDSRLHGNDLKEHFKTFYEIIKFNRTQICAENTDKNFFFLHPEDLFSSVS